MRRFDLLRQILVTHVFGLTYIQLLHAGTLSLARCERATERYEHCCEES